MIFLILTLLVINGIAKAVVDALSHGFGSSVFANLNHQWWNPGISWKNKYKPKNAFIAYLTSTIFVTFTDAWHTFEFIRNKSMILAASLALVTAFDAVVWWKLFILGAVINQTMFYLFYNIFRNRL